MRVYQQIASKLVQIENCVKLGNEEWEDKSRETLHDIEENYLPQGSGFDSGTTIDVENSTNEKIVLHSSYHHMDECGGYCGWTEFNVTVTPSLAHGFKIEFDSIEDEDDEYFSQVFYESLSAIVELVYDAETVVPNYVHLVDSFLHKRITFSQLRACTDSVKRFINY